MKRSLMVTVAMALSPDDKELEQKDEDNRGKKKKNFNPKQPSMVISDDKELEQKEKTVIKNRHTFDGIC